MSMGLISVVAFAMLVIAAIVVSSMFITTRRILKRSELGPRCGNCSYNLTGSNSNRCPECGKLFIEAGVLVPPGPEALRRLKRSMIRNSVIFLLVFVALGSTVLLGVIATVLAQRAALAQARAMQAQAAAVAAQAQAQLLAASQPAASQATK